MANSSFFKSDGQTTSLQTNLEDKAADAEKLAINPEDDQFTLSDGTTTGYSALHHKEKALDAQTAAEAARDTAQTHKNAASTSASSASTSATNSETSKVASVAAQTASEAARDLAVGYRDTAETHKDAAATSATSASSSASTASTKASEASTSAAAAAASQTAAAASAASAANTYDQFDDRYLGTKASDPTVDNDGNALVEGALYFSSTDNAMQVYDGSAWIAASSAGNVSITETHFTATAGQTTFNVSYTVDNLVVIMNGVVLQNGASKDYTATNGTSFTLATGAAAGDELHVIVFKSFTTADMVSKTNGGTYSGSVDFTGGLEINGTTVNATAAELNTLDGITATTTELNLLDGVTATTAELNYVDGVTSNIQTQIDNISTDVVSDTTPQLGGELDTNGNNISFGDSGGASDDRATFGASDDLQIYHNGSHSYVADSGTGNLYMAGSNVIISNPSVTETMAYFDDDGGVSLWYDNSKKFETTSTGVDVTGKTTTDGVESVLGQTHGTNTQNTLLKNTTSGETVALAFEAKADNGGTGNRGAIYFDAGASGVVTDNKLSFNADHQTSSTADLTITGSGNVGIGSTSPHSSSGYNTLTIDGSTGGQIAFRSNGLSKHYIWGTSTDLNIYNAAAGNLKLFTNSTERLRINANGTWGKAPSGTIIQIAKQNFYGAQLNNSTSYVDITGCSLNFACKNATSLVRVTLFLHNGGKGSLRILANGGVIMQPSAGYAYYTNEGQGGWASSSNRDFQTLVAYYDPNTTASRTYKAQLRSYVSGSNTQYGVNELFNNSSHNYAFIQCEEIAQ